MNRAFTFFALPFAFGLTTVLALLTGTPAEVSITSENSTIRSPRQRASAAAGSGDPSEAILEFERKILLSPAPPVEVHDAAGMEECLDLDDRRSRMGVCGGPSSITYSFEWAKESPEEMFAWLFRKDGSSIKRKLSPSSILFGCWAKQDMLAAIAAVFKIPDPTIRAQALASALEILYPQDPNRARELMEQNLSLFPADGRSSVFNPYDTGSTTCDLLLSLPPGDERTHLLATLLKSMAGWNIEISQQACAVWEQAPDNLRHDLVAAGFSNGKDEAVVFTGLEELMRERAETSGDPAVAEKFIEAQGSGWAKRDLAGALDWAQTHLKGKSRVERSAGLFENAANEDLDKALGVWQSLPDDSFKVRAAEAMLKGAPDARKPEADAALKALKTR
ncbi:MAG: hypothetical protein ABIT37_13485 [Luteolibacter sp.]